MDLAVSQAKKKLTREEIEHRQAQARERYRIANNLPEDHFKNAQSPLISPRIVEKNPDGSWNREYLQQFSQSKSLEYQAQKKPFLKDKDILKIKPHKSAWKMARLLRQQTRSKNIKDIIEKFWQKINVWRIFSPYALEIINLFIWCALKFPGNIQFAYAFIQRKIGCCIKTAQRIIDDLDKIGFLEKEVAFKQANKYKVNKVIFNPHFATLFGSFFSNLGLVMNSLDAAFNQLSTGGVLQTNYVSNSPAVLGINLVHAHTRDHEKIVDNCTHDSEQRDNVAKGERRWMKVSLKYSIGYSKGRM